MGFPCNSMRQRYIWSKVLSSDFCVTLVTLVEKVLELCHPRSGDAWIGSLRHAHNVVALSAENDPSVGKLPARGLREKLIGMDPSAHVGKETLRCHYRSVSNLPSTVNNSKLICLFEKNPVSIYPINGVQSTASKNFYPMLPGVPNGFAHSHVGSFAGLILIGSIV